jgi:choline dehydrogenase-like flavoprotein
MPNVKFMTQRVALRIESNGTRKAVRVLALDNHGNESAIEADIFILAAHSIENAAIVLRSSGIAQRSMLGKCLFDHPNFTVVFQLNREAFPAYGETVFTANCYEFYDGPFRRKHAAALGEIYNPGFLPIAYFARKYAMQGISGNDLRARVTNAYRKQLTINFLMEDLPDPGRYLRIGSQSGSLGFPQTEVFYTRPSNYVVEARKQILERIEAMISPLGVQEVIATDLEDHAGHLLGTCRMGTGSNSVVDEQLRYQELDNLFILGGSAFPTYSPANPTLTIAALAIRLAEFLKQ